MMTGMHRYITELLNGNLLLEEPVFELDGDFRAVDRADYQKYLSGLCKFIANEKAPFRKAMARLILERIVPDTPDLETTQCLLSGLEDPDTITRNLLLSHISRLKFPEGTVLEPLKELVRRGDVVERNNALEAFRAAPTEEGEAFLLEVLRRTQSSWDIETIAGILNDTGGIFSVPVLMARLENTTPLINARIYEALEKIAERLNMPEDIKAKFDDPDFWKLKWQGSKESFVGFMSLIAMLSGNGDNEDAADQIAEIFREEMAVDITPFQNYRELRLCSSGQDMFGAMAGMSESLESRILMEMALSGTGIAESKETQFQDIYFNMVNDYLFTRLRRKIQFADDDF